jgi:hypothetical protein
MISGEMALKGIALHKGGKAKVIREAPHYYRQGFTYV